MRLRVFTRTAAALGVAAFLLCGGLYVAGARINTTHSIPLGLYWITNEPLSVGVYVMFCPPKSHAFQIAEKRNYIGPGYCDAGTEQLMKRVLAAKGDTVTVTDEGVTVNGQKLPHTAPFAHDPAGRAMPDFHAEHYRLESGEILVMGLASPLSYDSRYFGPIPAAAVTSTITPTLTW